MLSSIVQIVKDMSACGPSRHFGAAQLLGRFRVNGHQPGGHKTGFMSTRPRLLPGAKFEGLWPRVESARRRKTAGSNGATLDLRGCN